MSAPWWAWLPFGGFAVARGIITLRPAFRRPAEPAPSPEPPDDRRPAEAAPQPEAVFTIVEHRQVLELADWWRSADPETRELGGDLATCLRDELPDVPPSVLARVLLVTGRRIEEIANAQDTDYSALRVTADAMFGAPMVLVDLDWALARFDADLEALAEERP